MEINKPLPFGKGFILLQSLADLQRACLEYSMRANDLVFEEFCRQPRTPEEDLEAYFSSVHRFLRAWRCRNLARKDEAMAVRAFIDWYQAWGYLLRDPEGDSAGFRTAYSNLVSLSVSTREIIPGRMSRIRMGHTAASKFLFALAPEVFPAWNRRAQVLFDADYPTYYRAIHTCLQERIHPLCSEQGFLLSDLPLTVGRPGSTLIKLLDEAISCGALLCDEGGD